jgi:hypothetical protein
VEQQLAELTAQVTALQISARVTNTNIAETYNYNEENFEHR